MAIKAWIREHREKLWRAQEILFFIGVALLPLFRLPIVVQSFFSKAGEIGQALSCLIWMVGAFLGALLVWSGEKYCLPRWLKIWLAAFFSVTSISIVVNVLRCPFWNQYDSTLNVLGKIKLPGIHMTAYELWVQHGGDETLFKMVSYLAQSLAHLVLEYGVLFILIGWIYFLFRQDFMRGLRILSMGCLAWILYCLPWGILEWMSLQGDVWAGELLKGIVPRVFPVLVNNGNKFPPLVFMGQMRLVFSEPSFIAQAGVVCLPAFLSIWLVERKWYGLAGVAFWTICSYYSHARSCYAVCAIFLVLICVAMLLVKRTENRKSLLCGVVCMGLAGLAAVYVIPGMHRGISFFVANQQQRTAEHQEKPSAPRSQASKQELKQEQKPAQQQMTNPKPLQTSQQVVPQPTKPQQPERQETKPVQKPKPVALTKQEKKSVHPRHELTRQDMMGDLFSIGKLTVRSNGNRYGIAVADFCIWQKNLLFGVGTYEIREFYIPANLPKWSINNDEIRYSLGQFNNHIKQNNAMNAKYQRFGSFVVATGISSMYGCIGLIVFIAPWLYMIGCIARFIVKNYERVAIYELTGGLCVLFMTVLSVSYMQGLKPVFLPPIIGLGLACSEILRNRTEIAESAQLQSGAKRSL